MALMFFKSFGEALTSDEDVAFSERAMSVVDTPYGKGMILNENVNNAASSKLNFRITTPSNPTLQTSGVTAVHVGFHARSLLRLTLGGVQIGVEFNTRSAPATIGGKGLSVGWHWVEIRINKTPQSTYTRQIRIDGEEYVNDTISAANIWTSTALTLNYEGSSSTPAEFTNPVVWNSLSDGSDMTSWMGPMQVHVLRPTKNGSVNQWLGSDGDSVDNWALVDETPVSTIDYVESSIDGQQDLYGHGGMPSGFAPLGVRAISYANKNGASLKSLKPILKSGSTVVTEPEKILNDAPRFISTKSYGLNPVTGLPWSRTDIDTLEFGVESSTPPA